MVITPLSSPLILAVIFIYTIVFLLEIGGIYLFQGKTVFQQVFQISSPPFQMIIWGIGSGIAVVLLSIISARIFRFIRILEKEFRMILGSLTHWEIIVIALLSSIAEETLFRGAIQPLLGLTITSFIFGILHFPVNRKYLPWTIFAIGMGFLLGWLYQYTNTLITPIITHMLINLINLWRICRPTQGWRG